METAGEISREEGELSDDSDAYVPLERPKTYSVEVAPQTRFAKIIESESEEEIAQSSSDSDSDVDVGQKPKKAKLKIKPKPILGVNPKKKKYDIWSTRIQEEVLSDTLNCCDVTLKDRSRDVESYDYTLSRSYRFNNPSDLETNKFKDTRTNNKRTRNDRKNINLRLKRKNGGDGNEKNNKGAPRTILDLNVNNLSPIEDVVKDLANKLYEEKEDLVRTIVIVAGKEKAFQVFKETQKIESEGGMLIMNQTRRRTPGGVFFFLVKNDKELTPDQHREIFGESIAHMKQASKERKKNKRQEMRAKAKALSAKNKELPELLTKAEICVQKLASMSDRTRKETDNDYVTNPPPTPETDGHDNENSGDGMDQNILTFPKPGLLDNRKVEAYEDDYLDMNTGADMDLF